MEKIVLMRLNKNPDLIILDYYFVNNDQKVMNGMEVFDKIKELKPDIPVIMLSGQEKGEIVLELARKGIDDYIIKDNNLIDNLNVAIGELFARTIIMIYSDRESVATNSLHYNIILFQNKIICDCTFLNCRCVVFDFEPGPKSSFFCSLQQIFIKCG